MSRNAELNQHIRDERQEQILTAAMHIFAIRGFGATTISDIAAESHVSQGLVIYYFHSKDNLFVAIIERMLKASDKVAREAIQMEGTPWERLHTLCTSMLNGVRHKPESVLLLVQITSSDAVPPKAAELLEQYGETTFHNLLALIQQGQDAGQVIAGNPVTLVMAITCTIQGLGLARMRSKTSPDAYFPDTDLILRMLKADK